MKDRLKSYALGVVASLAVLIGAPAQSRELCTVVKDAADGKILVRHGKQEDCAARYTPASTFKLPIALMGADAGILKGLHEPVFAYQPGYPDWGGEEWRKPTDPARWIKYSIFWYSQQIAKRLGQERFQRYTSAFGYGNEDASGDPGKHNGIRGAWVISSIRISPLEQLTFLRKVVNRELPIKPFAYDLAESLFDVGTDADGWHLFGKTGTGSPGSGGVYVPDNAYGWFVGWARKDGRTLVFARLTQDDKATTPNAGLRARDALIRDWPALLSSAPRQ